MVCLVCLGGGLTTFRQIPYFFLLEMPVLPPSDPSFDQEEKRFERERERERSFNQNSLARVSEPLINRPTEADRKALAYRAIGTRASSQGRECRIEDQRNGRRANGRFLGLSGTEGWAPRGGLVRGGGEQRRVLLHRAESAGMLARNQIN